MNQVLTNDVFAAPFVPDPCHHLAIQLDDVDARYQIWSAAVMINRRVGQCKTPSLGYNDAGRQPMFGLVNPYFAGLSLL